jgi:hypothetical protein
MKMILQLITGNVTPFFEDLSHGRAEPAPNVFFVPNRRVDRHLQLAWT